MAEIVLFHHVQGLTPGVTSFAGALRAAGHTVHTPDLFEGKTFGTIDEGLVHVRSIGFEAVVQRGMAAAASLPEQMVYAGMSLGVMPAQILAGTRPEARGALLLHGCLPLEATGGVWPDAVPVQIHAMEDDPWMEEDLDNAKTLATFAKRAELFLYPGNRHLFTDSSSADHDPRATQELLARALRFLGDT